MSTAEVMFNDSEFALLPGQETFVKSKVLGSGMCVVEWGGVVWRGGGSLLWAGKRSRWEEK